MLCAVLFVLAPMVMAGSGSEVKAVPNDVVYALERIESLYSGEQLPPESLVGAAIGGAMSILDVYSSYLDDTELKKLDTASEGRYVGIGAQLSLVKGELVVTEVIGGSAAALAGLLVGDVVVAIDGVDGLTGDLDSYLGGEAGSNLTFSVLRAGVAHNISMTRAELVVPSVELNTLDDGAIAVLTVRFFSKQTVPDVHKLLQALPAKPKGLIMDLRSNTGGLLEASIGVADAFLKPGLVIANVRSRGLEGSGTHDKSYESGDNCLDCDVPMVVLINGESASGAELIASAFQAHGRALLIGERTFGKGSMQRIFTLPSGKGAIKLTTATFRGANDKLIDGVGVDPDIPLSSEQCDTPDCQLARALDVVRYVVRRG
jgi:carboxyl-terminal processing protease